MAGPHRLMAAPQRSPSPANTTLPQNGTTAIAGISQARHLEGNPDQVGRPHHHVTQNHASTTHAPETPLSGSVHNQADDAMPDAMILPGNPGEQNLLLLLEEERRARITHNERIAEMLISEADDWSARIRTQNSRDRPRALNTVQLEGYVLQHLFEMRELQVNMNNRESRDVILRHSDAYYALMSERLQHFVDRPRLFYFLWDRYTPVVSMAFLETGWDSPKWVLRSSVVGESLVRFFDWAIARALSAIPREYLHIGRGIELHPLAFHAFQILRGVVAWCDGQMRNPCQLYNLMIGALCRDQWMPGVGSVDEVQPLPHLWIFMRDMAAYAAMNMGGVAQG